ncbi:UNVERIFIED_CONTAM: hypothetical protein FKN15_073125 [Acipenser sinensis]
MGPKWDGRGDWSDSQGTEGCRSGQRSATGDRLSNVRSSRGSKAANRRSTIDVWQQPSDVLVFGESGVGNQRALCVRGPLANNGKRNHREYPLEGKQFNGL